MIRDFVGYTLKAFQSIPIAHLSTFLMSEGFMKYCIWSSLLGRSLPMLAKCNQRCNIIADYVVQKWILQNRDDVIDKPTAATDNGSVWDRFCDEVKRRACLKLIDPDDTSYWKVVSPNIDHNILTTTTEQEKVLAYFRQSYCEWLWENDATPLYVKIWLVIKTLFEGFIYSI